MSLTQEQREAAHAAGSVAVVAGAGTGKTHMLSERYLHHLAEDGLSPLEVVAVTFTERAADELRSRIREKVGQSVPEAEETLAELEAAQISTIHALCARICREHPEEAEVPPDFSVLSDLGGQIWAQDKLLDALDELPAEHYQMLGYPTMQTVLSELLADPIAAERALEHGPDDWEALAAEASEEALRTFLEHPVVSQSRSALSAYEGPTGDKIEDARMAALSALESLYSESDRRPYLEALASINLQGGSKKKWGETEFGMVKDALRALRDLARNELKRGMITLQVGPADARLAEALPALRGAYESAQGHVALAKRRARVLDFADLEAHALKALEHESVRSYYHERWRAFLVDEFQDTNPVQAELLERLLAGGASLTIVGDEQQSIYGFRRAEVDVFRRFRTRIVDAGGREVVLSRSFRSHGKLVLLNNAVFSTVLGDLHQALVAHRTEPPHEAPHVRAYAIETEEKVSKPRRQRAEAALIARLLKEMLEEGLLVHDGSSDTLRPVHPGDIAILSRVWDPLDIYGEALAATGIPAVHAGGGNLLETREAKDGLALLRFLTDPTDELALVATLRSPFFAVDDKTLHELAKEREEGSSWWELVQGVSDEALSHAREVLERLLRARRFEPPGALLRLADRLTGYTAVIANLPGAPRREADWRGFCDLVDALGYRTDDVFSVVRSLKRMLDAGAAVPRPPLEAEEAVSLLTIHSAKGLEWPVVVIPDLSRQFPSSSSPVLFDPELGVAVSFGDEESGEGVLYRLLRNRKDREREAEARRVFYVAPTRARDHLILTSTEWETERLCGLTLLQPGLEKARIECNFVPFRPEDARPPDLPTPLPAAPPRLLTEPIAGSSRSV